MRAMRRVQGKGDPRGEVGGFRGIFTEARKKGKLLSEAYVASALIEHHCYQEPAAQKIFERGMKLFPEDEQFALEYIKHLIKLNDSTSKSTNSCCKAKTNIHRCSCRLRDRRWQAHG